MLETVDVTEEEKKEELESDDLEELDSEILDEEDEEFEGEDEKFLEVKSRSTKKEKEDLDEDIIEERFYTIPLRRAWLSTRKKRAPRAGRIVRNFVLKHMKIRTDAEEDEEAERLVIDNEVNEKIWNRGIEKPPRKIRVRVIKNKEGVVTVLLAEGD